MRVNSLVLATIGAIAATCFAAPAGAFTTQTSSAAIRTAVDGIDTVADVHCRPYRHWHPGYYGRGCGHTEIEIRGHRRGVVEEREGVRARVGVHSRSTTTRSETNVRSRESGTTRTDTRTRTGTSGSSNSGQGSMKSGGGSGGGQTSGGGSSSHSSGGGSNSTGNSPGGGQQTR